MHSLVLAAALALTAPLDESTPVLQARLLAELERPQAIADLFRLYERRDEQGDLGPLNLILERVAKSTAARSTPSGRKS